MIVLINSKNQLKSFEYLFYKHQCCFHFSSIFQHDQCDIFVGYKYIYFLQRRHSRHKTAFAKMGQSWLAKIDNLASQNDRISID